ncbi:hypothetical protein [Marmoricola sp. URHB0036]|uniref:hypothetical protein n=1 Tax=Marmoricola sp. URHB0036 TaxID=1298863 RepID=UPI000414B9D7|nr:hypothetical protein [Marmoricola sp. URHB0036]
MDDHTSSELDRLTIRTQHDLQHMWELLMHPLGFRSTSLWVTFIGSDDRPTRFLIEVSESDHVPDPREVANLYDVLQQVIDQDPDDLTVAFLISHPGRDGTRAFDRELSARLLAGARTAGVPLRPIHVADDVAVRAITPDDLAA